MNGWIQQQIYLCLPLSVSPNRDASGKQSLYADGDPDRHQNLTILAIGAVSIFPKSFTQIGSEVLRKVANRQTNNDENI